MAATCQSQPRGPPRGSPLPEQALRSGWCTYMFTGRRWQRGTLPARRPSPLPRSALGQSQVTAKGKSPLSPALVRGHPANLREGVGQGVTGGTLPCSICPKCDEQDPEEAGESATRKPQRFTLPPKLPRAQQPTPRKTDRTDTPHVAIKRGLAWGAGGRGAERASVSLHPAWDEGAF